MKFNLVYRIKRNDFFAIKRLNHFEQRMKYKEIQKHLFIQATKKVAYLEKKNIISKWWNDYKRLKELTTNYTYLDIKVEFWQSDSLEHALTNMLMYNMRKEGLI